MRLRREAVGAVSLDGSPIVRGRARPRMLEMVSEFVYELVGAVVRVLWTLFASPWFYMAAAVVAMVVYAQTH